MPKFVIEQDSSRKNANNEPLPLGQFVPGALSLKNTNQVYTLFVSDINNGALVDDIDAFKGNLKFYKELLTLLPRLRNDVIIPNLKNTSDRINIPKTVKLNPATGTPKPYVFTNINPDLIPHPNKNTAQITRKEIIKNVPVSLPPMKSNINLGNILKPLPSNSKITNPEIKAVQNKINEVINTPITKVKSLPSAPIKQEISAPVTPIQTPLLIKRKL